MTQARLPQTVAYATLFFPWYRFTTWLTLSTHTRVDHASQSVEHWLRLTTKKLGESSPKGRRESRENWREKRVALSSPAPLLRLSDFNVGSFSEMGRSRVYLIGRRPPLKNPLSGFPVDSLGLLAGKTASLHTREKYSVKIFRSRGLPTNCLEKRRAISKLTYAISFWRQG